jgi:uncharacterized protein (TIGR00369 family)
MTRADDLDVAGPADWGEPRQRTITWFDPAGPLHATPRSGIDMLRAIQDGVLPAPPMASVFGFRIVEVDVGRIVFECEPDESSYNPLGVVHGGLVCTLADTVAGCAVHTTLDAETGYTSIDLAVSYLRAVTADSGVLRATGTATKVGRRVGFAEARIVDGRGRDVATATSSLLLVASPSA